MIGTFSTSHVIVFALAMLAAVLFGAFILLGAWIDGRRQAIRKRGQHPVTTAEGQVEAREFEEFEAGEELKAKESKLREQQHDTGSVEP